MAPWNETQLALFIRDCNLLIGHQRKWWKCWIETSPEQDLISKPPHMKTKQRLSLAGAQQNFGLYSFKYLSQEHDPQCLVLKIRLFSFRGPQSKLLKETFLSVTSEQECMDKFGQITTRVTIDKNKVCAVDRAGQSDACQVLSNHQFKS